MKNLPIILSILLFSSNAYAYKYVPVPTESYLVADENGQILNEQYSDQIRPIASISKLMTALITSEQDLDEKLDIPTKREVSSIIPSRVKQLTRRELISLALVKSDNLAAKILCDNLEDCVDRMNIRAQAIGMENTHYVEPTGLDKGNVSTAQDLLKLVLVASSNSTITTLSSMPRAEIPVGKGMIRVNNTNPLTKSMNIVLSKTGFTKPAGGCLVMIMDSDIGRRIFILLGSKNVKTRIPDMKLLIKGQ